MLIVHHSTGSEVDQVCSGTLLAPNLVLTARHCVAEADSMSACTSDGTAASGGAIYADFDANELYVFAGVERPTSGSLAARSQRGSEIIDDGSTTLCNHDLALVLLATPVPDAKVAPVRLDAKTEPAEPVTLVGWGITDATSTVPTTRQQRTGEGVLAIGPADGLGAAELEVGEGPCQGDSGGPALAGSGAVIGTLSRGGNGSEDSGASACIGARSIYTEVSDFRGLVLSAYARAGQTPWLESQASPTVAAARQAAAPANKGGCVVTGRPVEGAGWLGWLLAAAFAGLLARYRAAREKFPSAPAARHIE